MPFSYQEAREGDTTTRRDTEDKRTEGFVVYHTETRAEYGVYATEEEAEMACKELNDEESATGV